jgi:DNA-binding response OmpR family regulator
MSAHQQPDDTPRGPDLELRAVLVVDDDQQLASALQWILADENYIVDVAFDGEEALLKEKAHEYDVVICDVKMPRMRGDEFYLNARDVRPNVERNEVKYLVKPFPVAGLIDCVKELLRG